MCVREPVRLQSTMRAKVVGASLRKYKNFREIQAAWDARLDRWRRTSKESRVPGAARGYANLSGRRMCAQRNNNYGGNRGRNRRGRMQRDTERAVVGVRCLRVDVRHLHHGQQSQQDQTYHCYHRRFARQGEQLAAPVGLNSAQTGSVSSVA
jgi:hypothetical protein